MSRSGAAILARHGGRAPGPGASAAEGEPLDRVAI